MRGIHRWSVNSPHKGPITRKNVSIWWLHRGMCSVQIWCAGIIKQICRQTCNISGTKSPKLNVFRFSSRLAVVFVQFIEARCLVENEEVVGAAPTGDAPTISEWPTLFCLQSVTCITGFKSVFIDNDCITWLPIGSCLCYVLADRVYFDDCDITYFILLSSSNPNKYYITSMKMQQNKCIQFDVYTVRTIWYMHL